MENIYSWSFSFKRERGQIWYILAGSIIFGLVLWGIYIHLYIMSVVIIFATGLFIYMENNSEEDVLVTITTLGIKINNAFYEFSKIQDFAIIYNGDQAEILRLTINKKGFKMLDIKINNDIAEDVRNILLQFVAEDTKSEFTMTDKLVKFLKL